MAKDLGIACGLNFYLDASTTMFLVNRRGLGKAKHVDMQNLWTQEASKSGRFVTKKVGTSVKPADLITKPMPRSKIVQLVHIMGNRGKSVEVSISENMVVLEIAAPAVGNERWIGCIRVPVTNSLNEQNLFVSAADQQQKQQTGFLTTLTFGVNHIFSFRTGPLHSRWHEI